MRPPLHLGVVAIEKGAFWSPSTMVANLYIYIYIYIYNENRKKERKRKKMNRFIFLVEWDLL